MSKQSVFNRGIRVLPLNDVLWIDEAGTFKPFMVDTRIIPYLQFFNPLNLKADDSKLSIKLDKTTLNK